MEEVKNTIGEVPKDETVKIADEIQEQLAPIDSKPVDNPEEAKKVITDYLNDKDVKNNVTYWANEFQKRFNGNWFTLEKVMKKTIFKQKHEAVQVLQLMTLSGVCHVTTQNNELKYKITLDPKKRLALLENEQERLHEEKKRVLEQLDQEYEIKMAALDTEIENIRKKIEEGESK